MLKSPKMDAYWDILSEYLLIVHDKDSDNIYKTQFGENIMKMKTQIKSEITLQHLIAYIYSRKYKCDGDMLKLLGMYISLNSPSEIIYSGLVNGKTFPRVTSPPIVIDLEHRCLRASLQKS
jgi:hypothetical protein